MLIDLWLTITITPKLNELVNLLTASILGDVWEANWNFFSKGIRV